MKLAISCFSLLVLAVFVQAQTVISPSRPLKTAPHFEVPEAAKQGGLGGRVTVYVSVDAAGNVVSVDRVTGPGYICSDVARLDVIALRETARLAAQGAIFEPAADALPASMVPLFFDFPVAKAREETPLVADDHPPEVGKTTRTYEVRPVPNGNPPPDYAGPVMSDGKGVRVAGTIDGGVVNGKAISLVRPRYPAAARAVRASGAVTVRVLIDEDGNIFMAEPISGHPLLRAAAGEAACGAKFSPTTLAGKPVKVLGVITYNFVP